MCKRIQTTGLMLAAISALAGLAQVAQAAQVSEGMQADGAAFALVETPVLPAVPAFDGSALSTRTPLPESLRGSKAMDTARLASKRGGTAVASEMQLQGVVANNRVSDAATGSNLITQGALNGAAGVPMVIQNSGNNVLIQNATIINLQLK